MYLAVFFSYFSIKLKTQIVMKNIILVFTTLILCYGCKNDDDQPTNPIDQLPPLTQTGENTFGYLINGEAIIVNSTNKITAIYQGGLLQLGGGIQNNNIDIDIRIILQDPLEENVSYDLTNIPVHRSRYIDFNQLNQCEYNYEDTYQGNIMFTNIDKVNYIISGTFSFSTIVDGCDDIFITNGRFDVKYIP